MNDRIVSDGVLVEETPSGKFKVGDKVKVVHSYLEVNEEYIVKEIYCDNFGCVLLKEPGGYGWGEHFLEKIPKG